MTRAESSSKIWAFQFPSWVTRVEGVFANSTTKLTWCDRNFQSTSPDFVSNWTASVTMANWEFYISEFEQVKTPHAACCKKKKGGGTFLAFQPNMKESARPFFWFFEQKTSCIVAFVSCANSLRLPACAKSAAQSFCHWTSSITRLHVRGFGFRLHTSMIHMHR